MHSPHFLSRKDAAHGSRFEAQIQFGASRLLLSDQFARNLRIENDTDRAELRQDSAESGELLARRQIERDAGNVAPGQTSPVGAEDTAINYRRPGSLARNLSGTGPNSQHQGKFVRRGVGVLAIRQRIRVERLVGIAGNSVKPG